MPNFTFHKIANHLDEIEFSSAGLAEVTVAGKQICIVLANDQLFACAAKCPHAGGSLAEGYVNASSQIVCPLHSYKFSLENGRNVSGEGYFLKTYSVETREDGIFVEIGEQ